VSEHVPSLHTFPEGHAWPQVPQLALSVVVFAQYVAPALPVHAARVPHVAEHRPLAQTVPWPHWIPQAPQFARSVWVLVH
jgi:hypothetical protein